MPEPATVADQPAVLEPEDADELIETLRHAATVIGALAGDPAAAAALEGCICGREHDITALWWDLQLAAGELDAATTAGRPDHDGENPPVRNASNIPDAKTRRKSG
jgi:hypothetical protein